MPPEAKPKLLIGEWEPTEAEIKTVSRAFGEALRYVIDTHYRFEGEGVERAVLEALSTASVPMIFDRYVFEMVREWEHWDENHPPRDLPGPPPEWWGEIKELYGDGVAIFRRDLPEQEEGTRDAA
jgi:hypothetical protein